MSAHAYKENLSLVDANYEKAATIESAISQILKVVDPEPGREGLRETPKRVAKAFAEMFSGYKENPEEILSKVFEKVGGYDDMVLVKDIPFTSHCEHHMVPFRGVASIAYQPNEEGVVGLSKLARLVDCFAKRLQTQETMTAQIKDAMVEHLQPRGVAVVIEAEHMCMCMRGIKKDGSKTKTVSFTGVFNEPAVRQTFFELMK